LEKQSLITMEITIKINEKSDVFSIISDLSIIWEKDYDCLKLRLDCACEPPIDGGIFVIISSIINELRCIGKDIIVEILTHEACPAIQYLVSIRFFKNISKGIFVSIPEDYPNHHFIEITHLASNIYNLNDAFLDIFDAYFDLNPESLNSLVFVFDELICNTTRHCQSKNGGYYFCQKNINSNTIEVIIVDSGIGIQKSLNRAFPHYNELTCLEECIKFGVTCGDGRGHGLYFIAELLKRNKGELITISGFSHLHIKNGEQVLGSNPYFQGTIVKCIFNLDNTLPIEQLLEEQNYLM
jgi:hypothetical protein